VADVLKFLHLLLADSKAQVWASKIPGLIYQINPLWNQLCKYIYER